MTARDSLPDPASAAADIALAYVRKRISVIPVPYKSKRPTLEHWQDLRLAREEDIAAAFRGPVNIGGLMGEASDGLIDVDLDSPEAIQLADELLPATSSIFGHTSKRRSHRLYRCESPPRTKRFQHRISGQNSTIVELRGDGAHTILPGSVHPTGEAIEWDEDGEPAPVNGADLLRRVAHLAAGALLAGLWPPGARHDAALALAGALLRDGWPVDLASQFIGAVARAAGDEDIDDRARAVATTAERLERREEVTGWPTLVEILGDDVIRKVRKWLGSAAVAVPDQLELEDGEPPPSERRESLVPSPRQPMLVAAKVIDDHHRDPSLVPTLRWWRGSFYLWSGGRWVEVEDPTVRAELYRLLRDATYLDTEMQRPRIKPWAPNRYKIADVCAAMAAIVHTEQDTATPSWLAVGDGDPPPRELVAVGNGLLHVPTRQLREHTPRLLNTVAVPFPYDPDAATPKRWLAFLSELWPDDPDARAALQEWFGYVISGDTSMHKILFLLGPLRSGKGTIARVLTSLVGNANTCGPTLASLSTNFGLQPLVGKSLAIVADARLGAANANVVVERLLSISGEDSLTIDRKYKEHWFGKLDTRIMILSNELPAFGDASGAIASRFVVLTLAKSWLGHENHQLTPELRAELPGILNWALDGLDRLQSRDRFTEPASARDAIVTLLDTVSPTSAFVRDICVLGPQCAIDVDVLYRAWRSWCEEQGRERPGSANTFGKNLRAVVPGVQRIRPRDDATRQYRYVGIRLRSITDRQRSGLGTNQDRVEPADPGPVLVGPETTPLLPTLSDPNAHAELADAVWIEL